MRHRFLILSGAALGLVAAGAAGCGDDGTTGSGAGQSAGGGDTTVSGSGVTGTGVTGTGPTTGSGMSCQKPAPQPGAPADVMVSMVSAVARDAAGAPITGYPMQLCGADLCLNGDTNSFGQVTFSNGNPTLDRPLFKPGDSLDYGKIGYPFGPGSPSPLTGYFPSMVDSGQGLAAGASVSASGATLTIAADGGFDVDLLTYDEPQKQTFRAATVPVDLVDDVTGSPDFSMVYALGPVDTLLCPPAILTVDNYSGIVAGADVEFWGQEVNVEELFGGYGEWVKLDDGTVSADGMTVSTTNGLPVLLTVAIKVL